MHKRIHVVSLLTAFFLAACSPDVVAPDHAIAVRKIANLAAGDQSGKFIVLMSTPGIPTGFSAKVASLGGTVRIAHSGAGFAVVSGLSNAGAAQLASLSGVAEVDADAPVSLDIPVQKATADATGLAAPGTTSAANPATALHFNWQWNMRLIRADKAWAAGKLGSPGVTVAILDTGMDYDGVDLGGHVDLNRSVSFMSEFIGGPTDVVTPSDDQLVTTIFPGRNLISDLNGHGTNVASQVSSNGLALAGVTSRTTLIGVKVLGANGVGSFGGILSGVLWAADHGADVANMSLGGSFSKAGNRRLIRVINAVFSYAKRRGMVIVVSAGNDGANLDHNGNTFAGFCDASHVICVASVGPAVATGNPDTPAFYTNFGRKSIDVAAPGGNAVFPDLTPSAWPWGTDIASWVWSRCSRQELVFDAAGTPFFDGCGIFFNYNGFIGTSQASPHVTGLAALLVADNGHSNPQKIKQLIEKSADPIDPIYGRGRIDVERALGLNRGRHDR